MTTAYNHVLEPMMFPRTLRISMVLGVLSLGACQSDSPLGPTGAIPDRVSITRSGAPLASFGDTAVVSTAVFDAEGRTLSAVPLRWSVSAPEILEPLGNGSFRARANGSAVVRVQVDPASTGVKPGGYYAGKLADSIIVTVQQQPARIVPTSPDTTFALLGATRTISIRITDARDNVVTAPVTPQWSTANSGVATVESTGRITVRGNGQTGVTVRAGNASWTGTILVNARRDHVSCMQFTQRKRQQQQCVTNSVTMWAAQEKTP